MAKNYFISGEFNVTCDVCSKKIKAHDAKQRWDGFIVCPDDYETRHPQDFVRARQDKISVPFSRPIPPENFRLRQPLSDEVLASDMQNSGDYIEVLSDYFLEDYMINYVSFKIMMNWIRTYEDSVDVAESVFDNVNKPFADTILISESVNARKTILRMLADGITSTDSGTILFADYVDSDYFAEDYVGTIVIF